MATFNTHFGIDGAGIGYDVVAAVERLDADVVALQEVLWPGPDRGIPAALRRDLGYDVHLGPWVTGAEPAGFADRFRFRAPDAGFGVVVASRLPLRAVREVAMWQAYADLPRVMLEVDVAVGDQTVTVRNVHLCVAPHGSLLHLAQLSRWKSPDGDARAEVVVGDFNLWGPVVGTALRGWRRVAPGPTWPSQRPHSQIDHVLLRGPVDCVDATVGRREGSDHRPIVTTLALGPVADMPTRSDAPGRHRRG